MIIDHLSRIEAVAVELVANVAPWLAPLPTAWLVYERTMRHLSWPWPVAATAGLTLELLGVGILATWLQLYGYNRDKRKSDPAAPVWLSLLLVALYFVTAEALTFALDVWPVAAVLAPALFPVLSVAAFVLLALRAGHQRRVERIEQDKHDAKVERARRKMEREASMMTLNDGMMETAASMLPPVRVMTKSERVIQLHDEYPDWTPAQLAEAVECSMSTVRRALGNVKEGG